MTTIPSPFTAVAAGTYDPATGELASSPAAVPYGRMKSDDRVVAVHAATGANGELGEILFFEHGTLEAMRHALYEHLCHYFYAPDPMCSELSSDGKTLAVADEVHVANAIACVLSWEIDNGVVHEIPEGPGVTSWTICSMEDAFK